MKILLSALAIVAAALSFGTTAAFADGGETGADRAHTQSNVNSYSYGYDGRRYY